MSDLVVSDVRSEGFSRFRHHGTSVRLGVGTGRGLGFTSGVEINFVETPAGRRSRGAASLRRHYVIRQELVREQRWHWVVTAAGSGTWVAQPGRVSVPDDPDPDLVAIDTRSGALSFLDLPGFLPDYFYFVRPDVHRVCTLQNFRLWCEVRPGQGARGRRASDDFTWNHLLYVGRTRTSWKVSGGELRKWPRVMATPV